MNYFAEVLPKAYFIQHLCAGIVCSVSSCINLYTNSQLWYATCDNHLLRMTRIFCFFCHSVSLKSNIGWNAFYGAHKLTEGLRLRRLFWMEVTTSYSNTHTVLNYIHTLHQYGHKIRTKWRFLTSQIFYILETKTVFYLHWLKYNM